MRVVLACPYAWDAPGGVQVHVRGLADGLAARGHEPTILAPASAAVRDPDVHVVGRPVRIPYGGKVSPISPSHAAWRRVREALEVLEPDLVHAHEPFSPSVSMFATLASRAPVVATFHAFHERSRLLGAASPLLRRVARRLDATIAVSEAAASFVAPVVPRVTDVVPNGVDVTRFASGEPRPDAPPPPVILWIGRLDPQKGFGVAVRAFAEIAAEREDATFVVAGDGKDRVALADLRPEIRRRVRMLGAVANEDLPGHLASASVFVAPATGHESFGVVLVEAMAAGVPVVATDIEGYREVVRDDVDGLLVRPGDPHVVAAAVLRVLGDGALATRLGASGRERSRTYGWDAVVPEIEAIYRRVAEGRSERLG